MSGEAEDYVIIPGPDRILDCSGLLGPLPIIKTSAAIKQVEIDQILQVIATDPGSQLDMVAWSRLTGHALLDSREETGKFIYYFQRLK